ncbi:hypothetical protein D3C79_751760 [compost metagenome]
MHLQLVEGRLDHLDRVFDGAQVDLRGGQVLEAGVKGAGLARAGGPGDQDDAMAMVKHRQPAPEVGSAEAQLRKVLLQQLRVEDSEHQLFAEGSGQGRQPQLDLFAARQAGLDPAILGAALFCDIHAPQAFQAADHSQGDRPRELVDRMQHAVDTKAQLTLVAPGFEVNIAGALFEGVLQ